MAFRGRPDDQPDGQHDCTESHEFSSSSCRAGPLTGAEGRLLGREPGAQPLAAAVQPGHHGAQRHPGDLGDLRVAVSLRVRQVDGGRQVAGQLTKRLPLVWRNRSPFHLPGHGHPATRVPRRKRADEVLAARTLGRCVKAAKK